MKHRNCKEYQRRNYIVLIYENINVLDVMIGEDCYKSRSWISEQVHFCQKYCKFIIAIVEEWTIYAKLFFAISGKSAYRYASYISKWVLILCDSHPIALFTLMISSKWFLNLQYVIIMQKGKLEFRKMKQFLIIGIWVKIISE